MLAPTDFEPLPVHADYKTALLRNEQLVSQLDKCNLDKGIIYCLLTQQPSSYCQFIRQLPTTQPTKK